MYRKDLTGMRFGRLTCLGYAGRANDSRRRHQWHLRCDCGNEITVPGDYIKNSCGCLRLENSIAASKKNNTIHGRAARTTRTRTYGIWVGMRSRCNNPRTANYRYYGARGIRVCKRWDSYEYFLADMGEAPPNKSIDRIRVNGNYEPDNCVWATAAEQAINKRKQS